MAGDEVHLDGVTVTLSRLDKVLFPHDGITKGELIDHYRRVAPRLVPAVRERPLALSRYPDGIEAEGFFQQAAPRRLPDWVQRRAVPKERGTIEHVVCDNAATLVYLANQAAITLHAWSARADKPRRPDQMIFDLDPFDGHFTDARWVAGKLHELLTELSMPALVKTTGGTGLHVTVPLRRRYDFDTVRDFARDVADLLARREPRRLTTEVRKEDRGERLYLDISRNAYAQTVVPPYTVRARAGAPIAAPLRWSELEDSGLEPRRFTLRDSADRLDSDPWHDAPAPLSSLRRPRRVLDDLRAQD